MRLLKIIILTILLIPAASNGDHTDSRLDDLFLVLLQTEDLPLLRSTEGEIWAIWFEHPNADVERLMQLGVQRMNYQSYTEALAIFNNIVESFPDFAEAWNRRATLHYIVGNYEASITDIEKVLALEPRHFGALSGLGMVYLQQEELSKAKQAFEDLIDVHPNSPNAKQNLEIVNESLRFNII